MQIDIARLADIARFIGDDFVTSLADELIEQLQRGELNLLVVGQFKRGKSTLVNALLGADIMPTGSLPMTGVITTIRYGPEPAITVELRGRGIRSIAPVELPLYVTEQHNPGNGLKVERVDVQWPSDRIRGFAIFDTPGVGSTFEHNTSTAYAALPRADAAILVLGPEPPIGASEVQYAQSVLASSEQLFIVLNKSDLAGQDLPVVVEFTRNAISQALKHDAYIDVVPMSATRAREQQKEHGEDPAFADFVSTLARFAREQGETTRHRSARRRAASLIQQLDTLLAMRRAALNLPLDERDRRRHLVEKALEKLDDRVPPLLLTVDDDVKRLINDLQAELDRSYSFELSKVSFMADNLSKESSARKRSKLLEDAIAETAQTWRAKSVASATAHLHSCATKYERLAGEYQNAALHAGCNALGIDARALEPHQLEFASAHLQLVASLEPTTGLELVVAFFIDLLPMIVRQRILKRRLKDTLTHELDALRGKLRFGISRDLNPWRRSVHDEIVESVDRTRQSVLNVFRELSSDGETTAIGDLDRLTSMRQELSEVGQRISDQGAS